MSGDVTLVHDRPRREACSSGELADAIRAHDFSGTAVTVIGCGYMGLEYVKALDALKIGRVRVCSRSPGPLEALQRAGVTTLAGGFERMTWRPDPDELGIVATSSPTLVPAVERLIALGFRRLLIEKPVSLWSREIERVAEMLSREGVEGVCAYNRVAYPAFHEVRAQAARDGGITSCTYTFTELIKPDWPQRFEAQELARWGVANSLHVVSMAHGLIGPPARWQAHRSGALPWHPTGAVFVGSGESTAGVPFAYHADWGSTGRWSVEAHTAVASYRLCPLETVGRKTSFRSEWEPVPVTAFAPEAKPGLAEQVAAMMCDEIRQRVPLVSLQEAAALVAYGEDIFGYTSSDD